ncbi:MAG: flagellin [Fibrobacterota bacterium]|nr:flagellin [Chitinispirillaceae bacterium]
MLTSTPMTVLTGRLSAFFKTVENQLSDSLTKVASGKRVESPFDNITDYFHARNYKREYTDFDRVRTDVAETSAMLDVASHIGEQVFDSMSNMRTLVDEYYKENVTSEDRLAIAAEFNAIKDQVAQTIENGYYDGKKLVADTSVTGSLKKVNLDPKDLSQMFSVDFSASQVTDTSGLTIGSGNYQADAGAVQAELDKAGSYLGSVAAYSRGIKAQYNLVSTKILATKAAESNIVDIDAGREMALATKRSIQHQSTATMIAQANMVRASIVKVLNF